MKLEELFDELNKMDFIESYHISDKRYEDSDKFHFRVLKMYGEDYKIAEVVLDKPFMLRTIFPGFIQLNMLQQQALLQQLEKFAVTPIEQRRSELYLAYYRDLNNITHFIKRLSNNRLTDEILPMASFNNMSEQTLSKYLFTIAELENFPKDYQPSFDGDSFVKVISQEDMELSLRDRYGTPPSDED